MKIPVVIFCFNRAKELSKTLSALKKANKSRDRKYYVFLDGARNDSDLNKSIQLWMFWEALRARWFQFSDY